MMRILSRPIFLVLLIALVHGAIHVFLAPPWQHYDEPAHFEYAWLIASRLRLPHPGDADPAMQRETMRSMAQHGFYANLGMTGDVDAVPDSALNLGYTQLDDPPVYYLLAAVPIRLSLSFDVVTQLYLARLVSLALYLASIAMAGWFAQTMAGPTSPLRWLVPLFIALLPGYAELMTAVNSDVGAIVFFFAFIAVSVKGIREGWTPARLVALVAVVLLCVFTKRTSAIVVLIAPLAVLLGVSRRRLWPGIIWIGLGGAVLAVFAWGDAADWYRGTQQASPTRAATDAAGRAGHALQLEVTPDNPSPAVLQLLNGEPLQSILGQPVTLGAWMWATRPVTAQLPQLVPAGRQAVGGRPAAIGVQPAFYSYVTTIPTNELRMNIILQPELPASAGAATVYYDDVVLVSGAETSGQPQLNDAQAGSVMWNGHSLPNLVRNSAMDAAWPYMRPVWTSLSALKKLPELMPFNLVVSPLDPSAGWYFTTAATNILRSFWGKFAWGNIEMPAPWYAATAILMLAGLAGAVIALVRYRVTLPWSCLLFLGLVGLVGWGLAWTRGIHSLLYMIFIPSARYGYTALLPVALLLSAGWLQIGRLLKLILARLASPALLQVAGAGIIVLIFVTLDVTAIFTIAAYHASH